MKSSDSIFPCMPSSLTPGLLVSHAALATVMTATFLAASAFRDAEDAMAFYGVYHSNPWNQLVHFVGVPMILWSFFVMSAHLPLTDKIVLRLPFTPRHYPSWATVALVFYCIFYLSLDLVGAVAYLPFLYLMYASSIRWTRDDQHRAIVKDKQPEWTGTGTLLRKAWLFQILGWYLQIHIGHKIAEGSQPALAQSLGGALTTAPLFAFHEVIWYAGLRKEFQQRILQLVDEYTLTMCEKGANMRVCESLAATKVV